MTDWNPFNYVTYLPSGELTGGYLQEMQPAHADAYILCTDFQRMNWPQYSANETRDGLLLLWWGWEPEGMNTPRDPNSHPPEPVDPEPADPVQSEGQSSQPLHKENTMSQTAPNPEPVEDNEPETPQDEAQRRGDADAGNGNPPPPDKP